MCTEVLGRGGSGSNGHGLVAQQGRGGMLVLIVVVRAEWTSRVRHIRKFLDINIGTEKGLDRWLQPL